MAKATEQTMKPIMERPAVAISLDDNELRLHLKGAISWIPPILLNLRQSPEISIDLDQLVSAAHRMSAIGT